MKNVVIRAETKYSRIYYRLDVYADIILKDYSHRVVIGLDLNKCG